MRISGTMLRALARRWCRNAHTMRALGRRGLLAPGWKDTPFQESERWGWGWPLTLSAAGEDEAPRGRWESEAGEGKLVMADVGASRPAGSEVVIVLPGEDGERPWLCRVEGEQFRLIGEGTTIVARAIVPEGP